MDPKSKLLALAGPEGHLAALRGAGRGFLLVALLGIGQTIWPTDSFAQKTTADNQPAVVAAQSSPLQTAYNLYLAKQYSQSAVAFEAIIEKATPEPRLYYYAALANRENHKLGRTKQLFEYISKNFPNSPEAACAQAALGVTTAKSVTEAVATAPTETAAPAKKHVKGALAFSTDEIAKEGANAIDQSRYPNCWFEASMSALAQLPRGQRMLANMIHYGDGDKYIVRFPGDGKEYVVSEEDAKDAGITNRAVWASLLECAQIKKFPDNQGASGAYSDQSRLEVGMGCITGCKAEEILVRGASVGELSSFIGGAVRSQSPITAGTTDPRYFANFPTLVVGPHAYTVIGLDPVHNMVILRNPHGAKSRRFSLPGDPQHLKFEQLEDGVFKMSLEIFPNYFVSMARSFI